MSITTTRRAPSQSRAVERGQKSQRKSMKRASARDLLTSRAMSAIAIVIALLWTTPTLGLLISSFRPRQDINSSGWWTVLWNPHFTLSNYTQVLFGGGTSGHLASYLVNSLVIVIPSVLLPLVLALLCAYLFAFVPWKGRDVAFTILFGLQIVPIQMTLIPLLKMSVGTGLSSISPFLPVWLMHTIFALPLAVFLLHNFMCEIPSELMEAARVDGASNVGIFLRVVLPLMKPAIAAYATLQFLWVWNDLLIALTFAGGKQATAPLTVRLATMAGTNGLDWHVLTAGAFVSMAIPLGVFFALERHLVRGLLAGSVKG